MRIKTAYIALILSILALAVSLFTAAQVSRNDDDALIDALLEQNQQLQAQIDALAPQVPDPTGSGTTASDTDGITLTAMALADNSGADVTLTMDAEIAASAHLRVMLGSEVITEAPCVSDGSQLMATARIPAENGYTYSVVLGSEVRTLASPDDPVYPELVYLADALSAYCTLVVGDAHVSDNVLTLENGYAHIHTPKLGSTTAVTCTAARLVMKHGDTVLAEVPVSPVPDEEPGDYFCDIANASFALPVLSDGEEVELHLEVTLSDNQILTHCAATWYVASGEYSMVAG